MPRNECIPLTCSFRREPVLVFEISLLEKSGLCKRSLVKRECAASSCTLVSAS
jgi:hypothetical protein